MNPIFTERHSVRSFQSKPVSQEQKEEILKAAYSAPSAGNLKAREIIVVEDIKLKQQVAEIANDQDFIAEAGMVLIFFALPDKSAIKYKERGINLYSIQDATISAGFAWLQAVDLGLAGCWVGGFDEGRLKQILGIEKNWRPVAILPIGYEAEL